MKSKILPITLFTLILLNGILIFLLINKPNKNKEHHIQRNFLVEQLEFSDTQRDRFFELDHFHRDKMMDIEKEIRKNKDLLFNSFGKNNFKIDSIVKITGDLESKRDYEVFQFFSSVRKICSETQKEKFDNIISKAIKGGKANPSRKREHHFPEGDRRPPPPR